MELYVGCDLVSTYHTGQASVMVYGSSNGSLGRHDSQLSGPPGYFAGIMDEVALWNRALSLAEIQMLCEGQLATVVSISEQGNLFGGLRTFPNPVRESMTISFDRALSGTGTYIILDALLNSVGTGSLASGATSATVNVADLPVGGYWLIAHDSSMRRMTSSFVVIR